MFFTFDQNNSGGQYSGPKHVIIEAASADEANRRAEDEADIYFDGVYLEWDCPCCGDRWSEVWSGDGDEVPSVYGKPVDEWNECLDAVIYYLDGTVERVETC